MSLLFYTTLRGSRILTHCKLSFLKYLIIATKPVQTPGNIVVKDYCNSILNATTLVNKRELHRMHYVV